MALSLTLCLQFEPEPRKKKKKTSDENSFLTTHDKLQLHIAYIFQTEKKGKMGRGVRRNNTNFNAL